MVFSLIGLDNMYLDGTQTIVLVLGVLLAIYLFYTKRKMIGQSSEDTEYQGSDPNKTRIRIIYIIIVILLIGLLAMLGIDL